MNERDKIKLFRRRFAGREDVYGTYDTATGRARQVKAPVTDEVIASHLKGEQPYGVYLLVHAHVGAAVFDFDEPSLEPIRLTLKKLKHYHLPAYVERSKSKGHHVWLFFQSPVHARDVRRVLHHVLANLGQHGIELFPKQDELGPRCRFGNFIYAPLFGQLVCQHRTVFLRNDDLTKPVPDQWKLLEDIVLIAPDKLEEVLRLGQVDASTNMSTESTATVGQPSTNFGLPRCAQRMLAEGVRHHQRNACFRLGVNLCQQRIPQQAAEAVLYAWARRNRPEDGKRIITPFEIKQQLKSAYSGNYRGYGCETPAIEPFCDPKCPVRRRAAVNRSTNATERNEAMPETTSNRPYKEFTLRGLNLAIWRNEVRQTNGRLTTRYNITLNKRYKDKETGEWKDTQTYFPEDLPLLRAMLDKASEETLLTEPTPVTTTNALADEPQPSE